jgi:FKBP-type peptidyl-prolyl cis-trans isomerase
MRITLFLTIAACAQAFSPIAVKQSTSTTTTALNAQFSRKDFLQSAAVTAAATVLATGALPAASWADETLPSGVVIQVIKKGDGAKPERGQLAAIRFSAYAGDNKVDDIFDSPEPYYTRVGSGGMLKVRSID